jgi:glucose/arabinose dehydrogenase/mono/diheme cytochrome c family protein
MSQVTRCVIPATALAMSLHAAPTAAAPAHCTVSDRELTLPPGFCATVFADHLGHPRHLVVARDGTVYVNTWSGRYYAFDRPPDGAFIVALRDTAGTGRADEIHRFGPDAAHGGHGGTGIALHRGALYAEEYDKIMRYPLTPGQPVPRVAPTRVVSGLPLSGDHPMHPFAIAADGSLFVNSGSASNACQKSNRSKESPGVSPCVELETRAGIWRYEAGKDQQKFSPRERYATGIRNAGGVSMDPTGKQLYATQHGRDQLAENWPALYRPRQGADLPAEQLMRVDRGDDYGWPYCYFDSARGHLVLAPEYAGDGGAAEGLCASKKAPLLDFPAHWAPMDVAFYSGTQFPAHYRGGAFIAFHGSWNRAPFPQEGYNVVFVPFSGQSPAGSYEVFADGFAGPVKTPSDALHRPAGLAVAPDGALFITDDRHGRLWRVTWTGEVINVASDHAAESSTAPAATPIDPVLALGRRVYLGEVGGAACTGCHGQNGDGGPLGPSLHGPRWLWSDGSVAAIRRTIAEGVATPREHTGSMPPMGGAQLTGEQLDAVSAWVYSLSHSSAAQR